MNILQINIKTLANLYEQFPNNFQNLSISGNNLIYNGKTIDISSFNINDLLNGDTNFASFLNVLSSEDIFKIIRLHVIGLKTLKPQTELNETENRLAVIKSENPLLKNINIIRKIEGSSILEYFNIVDSNGSSHLFKNDRKVNIFDIYETLKYAHYGQNITPEEFITAIKRKLDLINLEEASTFENNDIITQPHSPNVTGKSTTTTYPNTTETSDNIEIEENNTQNEKIIEFIKKEKVLNLISLEEFYRLLNSPLDLTQEERKSINLYYAYLGDLIIYEYYLLPQLLQILNSFRNYIYELEIKESNDPSSLNKKQQEALNKNQEFENKKESNQEFINNPEKVKEEVQKLELKYSNPDSLAGSITTLQVLLIIIIVSIILTAITLNIIG